VRSTLPPPARLPLKPEAPQAAHPGLVSRWRPAPPAALALAPLVVAALLSAWSLDFGLPYLFRPDEEVMVGRSVHVALAPSLDPLFYNYPPLAFYLFAVAETAVRLLGHPLGPATQVDPTTAYLAARAVSALAFVACTAFVYATARVDGGEAAGFLAATCLALSPLAVRQAHFATPDSLAMAFVAAAIWAGRRAASPPAFLAAGACCGLAAGTKYTAGMVLVFVLAMAVPGPDWRRRALAAALGALAVFAVLVALAGHPLQHLQGLGFLAGRAAQEYGGLPIGLVYHPVASLPFGLGLGAYALALAGAAVALVRRRRSDLALLAFLLAYLLSVGFSHEVFYRYVLPALPPLCLLAGGVVRSLPPGRPARAAALLGALLLLLPSAYASVTTDRLLGATDTREQAARWLLDHAPAGSGLRISSYWGQPFYDEEELGRRRLNPLYVTGDPIADSFQQGVYTDRFRINRAGSPCFTVAESGPPWQAPLPATDRPPAAVFQPYVGSAPRGAVYDPIDSFYLPIWGFAGIERPGASIVITRC
jgi:hypothetical protein